ncbi:hypothetical protein EDL79_00325 [Ehrlichia ruminantium]|uniref:Uncharacterized protein n=1 Tax=Ehrlichia ruminantium TaxID=779 RepID=A0AAE6QA62_EHRRU|nr:hypothetical protein EDL80_00325 [Ehrlichia ruminantium]QGR03993.1 hypothetical protein EDL79_00325 [Ehrlichia ruminantium]
MHINQSNIINAYTHHHYAYPRDKILVSPEVHNTLYKIIDYIGLKIDQHNIRQLSSYSNTFKTHTCEFMHNINSTYLNYRNKILIPPMLNTYTV